MAHIPYRIGVARFILTGTISLAAFAAGAAEMPKDFVYLRDVEPTIQQDMRYAGSKNFTGKPAPGYDAPECVLARPAAEALKAVQADLRTKGLALKVYDCYRPVRAVAAFVNWANGPDDPQSKAIYYPNIPKGALIPDYIAPRSGHSRGAAVDLTLVPLGGDAKDRPVSGPCTAPQGSEAPDGSLAMGTTFDCFDGKSGVIASNITAEQNANRIALDDAMEAHGFKDYFFEWWHFVLANEPYPDTVFDFPILPRQ
jgi:D-alanyl-D-alanine dipeptidase